MESISVIVQPDVVFLEPVVEEEVRESGIIVNTPTATRSIARISHMHDDTALALALSVGDNVVFNPYSVREIQLDATTKRLAIHPGDILAKVVE